MKWAVVLLVLCAGLPIGLGDDDLVNSIIAITVKSFLKRLTSEVDSYLKQYGRELHIHGRILTWIQERNMTNMTREALLNIQDGDFTAEQLNLRQQDRFFNALEELYQYHEGLDPSMDPSLVSRARNYSEAFDLLTKAPLAQRQAFCHNIYDSVYEWLKDLKKEYLLPTRKVYVIGCHLIGDLMRSLSDSAIPSEQVPENEEQMPDKSKEWMPENPLEWLRIKMESWLKSREDLAWAKLRSSIADLQGTLISVDFFRNTVFAILHDCFYKPVPFALQPIPGEEFYDIDPDSKNLKIFEHLMDLALRAEEKICPVIKDYVDKEYPSLDVYNQIYSLIPRYLSDLQDHDVPVDLQVADLSAMTMMLMPVTIAPEKCFLRNLCRVGLSAVKKPSQYYEADILIGRLISYDTFPEYSNLPKFKSLMDVKLTLGSRIMAKAVWDGKKGDCSNYPEEACEPEPSFFMKTEL